MGLYNHLTTELTCLRCQRTAEMTIDLYFGLRDFSDFKIGDIYQWTNNPRVENGGRPENGSMDGEGYVECPHCHRDFFVVTIIENDRIIAVKPNGQKLPYIK